MNYYFKQNINTMKNTLTISGIRFLLIVFLISSGSGLMAQLDAEDFPVLQEKIEQIEAQKIAFLTNKLKLTTTEAQQFWPVYNEIELKKKGLHKEYGKQAPDRIDLALLSDQEAEKIADDRLVLAQKELDLAKEFHHKMKEVLPPKKVLLYYEADKQFKRILLQRLKNNNRGGRF